MLKTTCTRVGCGSYQDMVKTNRVVVVAIGAWGRQGGPITVPHHSSVHFLPRNSPYITTLSSTGPFIVPVSLYYTLKVL